MSCTVNQRKQKTKEKQNKMKQNKKQNKNETTKKLTEEKEINSDKTKPINKWTNK